MAKNFVEFEDALSLALSVAKATQPKEFISVEDAVGRVVASDIVVVKNLPSFNNAALDGFAFRDSEKEHRLKVAKVVYAGDSIEPCLGECECYKIMTGAKVPDDADTLVAIENSIDFDGEMVSIPQDISKGFAIRLKGEEAREGELLYACGYEIKSSDIATLSSQGITHIEVYKALNIAVVSTGSELKEPWEVSSEDEIYNCNSLGVVSTLKSAKFEASYIKAIPDNLEDTIEFISTLKRYDVIITSGGISMGDADFVAQALESNGFEKLYDGVNIKPGKPMMVGSMGDTFVISLPGNPLTTLVNLNLFAMPILRKLQGHKNFYHNTQLAINKGELKLKAKRVNIILGTLQNGEFRATMGNKYGSGMITVVSKSNAMLVTSNTTTSVEDGTYVRVVEFSGGFVDRDINYLV